jgi:hypothetical protein
MIIENNFFNYVEQSNHSLVESLYASRKESICISGYSYVDLAITALRINRVKFLRK